MTWGLGPSPLSLGAATEIEDKGGRGGTRYVQWRHCDDSTQFATRGEAGSVQNFLSICSPSIFEHMANNTDEENCGEDIWIYKKPW